MNKRILRLPIAALLLGLVSTHTLAQEKMDYWRDASGLLQEQSRLLFDQSYAVLDKHRPSPTPSDERKLALFALDALLHDTRLDTGEALFRYMDGVGKRVLRGLDTEVGAGETRIHRLYNQAAIVQTPQVTIAFDLVRGGIGKRLFFSDSLMQAIVDRCDILFVSHEHGDHADLAVARMFSDQGKEVIVPTGLWEGQLPSIIPMRENRLEARPLSLKKKSVTLDVAVFPGHQDKVANNVYIVTTPAKKTIVHTGDQSNAGDVPRLAEISRQRQVDILLAHCWMRPMEQIVNGIDPALVILGHENEMGHTIDHREAYWLTFRRIARLTHPAVVMAWGEYIDVNDADSAD
ncbi:MBL fold metallo-hydrolase [Parapedobacter sp. GCM10030251]|uniref:MBL fold metallo-hydrolase n=1 Tax=Parapedobacter sp. GCM10030251 TaxID=3273419 RepID=UPI003609B157